MVKADLAEATRDQDSCTRMKADILLVEDDEIFAATAGRILREAGYSVRVAPGFREALDVLDGAQPLDLMMTDIVMPQQVNGVALARMGHMRRRGLKVIYVTGYDIPGLEEQAEGLILRKPVSEEQLLFEVNRILTGH